MSLLTQRPQEDVSINLLPSDVKSEQRTQRWFQYGIAISATIIFLLIAVLVYFRLQVAHQQDVLRDKRNEAAALQTQVDALQEYADLKAAIDAKRALLAVALAGDLNYTKILDDIDSTIPVASRLASLSISPAAGTTALGETSLGTVTFAGVVETMPALAGWLDTMSEITGLRFVYLSNGSKAGDRVSFASSAHITEEMLSNRCTTEDAKCP